MLRLLDTTVLIDYLRGRPAVGRVQDMRTTGEVPCTSAINLEEIVRGLRPSEATAAHQLVAGLRVLPIGEPEAWLAGRWRQEYAKRGVTLWQADCLIAATARTARAVLVTGNPSDFPMDDVKVVHWPVGE